MDHIVETFYIGETEINICDTFCKDVSDEQIQETLENIVKKSIGYFQLKTA